MVDYLIAFDDQLVERHRACLLCGAPSQWMDIRAVRGRAVFACQCARCHDQDGWHRIDALLAARYGALPPVG